MDSNKIYISYKSKVVGIDKETGKITTENTFDKNEYLSSLNIYDETIIDGANQQGKSNGWAINYNSIDTKNLNVLMNVGGNKSVIVNSSIDAETTKLDPYSVVLKTYEPLVNNITSEDKVSVVKEMAEPIKDTIRLVPFNDADLGDRYLYQPNNKSIDYINNWEKELKKTMLSENILNDVLTDTFQPGFRCVFLQTHRADIFA